MTAMPDTDASTTAAVDLRLARRVLEIEAAAITALLDRIDQRFVDAVTTLDACAGRVIVTGMGKSGIISRKIAATLSSTGTPAFFLHPAEAVHGDLGVIQADDVVVALSHTGETTEILGLLETIKRVGARVICLTGAPDSTLAQAADVALDCQVRNEACPMNLVPTASTTSASIVVLPAMPTCAASRTFRPSRTPCPTCTRLSIFVPAWIRVSPIAGRSIATCAPISTSSSMTTPPTCGIFRCVPSGRSANPNPSLPITAAFCNTTRSPIITRSRTAT